jgi:hydroxypyruvate reductase
MNPRALLLDSFNSAVAAADPLRIVAAHLPGPPAGKTLVVGAGKAAAAMARAVELAWPAQAPLSGEVITRYGHGLATRRVAVIEAGHPVPDEAGEQAASRILEQAAGLGPDDLLLALISGGGSSLLSLPVGSVPMADLKAVTRQLLASGAPIQEMNIVRKHLSRIQGGRLAQATRARVCALVISDVAGDEVSAIGSGPCAPDPSTYADAIDVLSRWRVEAPERVAAHLARGVRGEVEETPKPGNPMFSRIENRLIASAHRSLEAAAATFEAAGVRAVILGDTVTGEARDVAQVMAALVREIRLHDAPFKAPLALISGGECTVTLPAGAANPGRGGRCSEFLLALHDALGGLSGIHAIAADTDGIDGVESNAGALIDPTTAARAAASGLDARHVLDRHDAWSFFSTLGDLVVTGPTRTNVNDYRAILVT